MRDDLSTLTIHLRDIADWLKDESITELCVNTPGVLFIERPDGWERIEVPALTYDWCQDFAKLVANYSNDSVSDEHPLLSAQLPTGERVQVVLPPTVPVGTVSITIRRPSTTVLSFDEILAGGAFEETRCVQSMVLSASDRQDIEKTLSPGERELLTMFRDRDWASFFPKAVKVRKNIVTSGQTGSGKTTLCNALIGLIPLEERLLTVEDVREARLPHENAVSLVYNKGERGLAKVSPKMLFEVNMRQRPDRVLPAELRGDETFYFLQNVINSGHPGAITSVHANAAKLAFLRLSLMVKASPEGAGISREDVLSMLYSLIDVIAQMERVMGPDGHVRRAVTEVYYDPAFAAYTIG